MLYIAIHYVGGWGVPRIFTQVKQQRDKLQHVYDKLAGFLSEATVQPELLDRTLACIFHG